MSRVAGRGWGGGHSSAAPVTCSSPKRANKTLLTRLEKGSPRTDSVHLGKRRWPQVMHCTGPQLHFCADGELRAAQPYSLCGSRAESGATFGSGSEESMAKALAAADAAHPVRCAFLLARAQPLPDI